MSILNPSEERELDRRHSDGIDVRLLWNPRTDRVRVAVNDERHGEAFDLDVDPAEAMIAFRHPYAYAQAGQALAA